MNTTVICGVFRSGGDSRFGFICDTIDMWVFSVPLGFISAFVLKLPPMWVYFLLCLDEFVKMPFVYITRVTNGCRISREMMYKNYTCTETLDQIVG